MFGILTPFIVGLYNITDEVRIVTLHLMIMLDDLRNI